MNFKFNEPSSLLKSDDAPTTVQARFEPKRWFFNVNEAARVAEHRLLSHLSCFNSLESRATNNCTIASNCSSPSNCSITATSRMTRLPENNHEINTFSIYRSDSWDPLFFDSTIAAPTPSSDGARIAVKHLVLCHGYGAGLGVWFLMFPRLAQFCHNNPWLVHAIDWLGMGRSSRVPLPKKVADGSTEEDVASVEAYFVDSLESWRIQNKIKTMTLLGHSIGAYNCIAYALKYPQCVDKLILASPGTLSSSRWIISTTSTSFNIVLW